MKKEYNFMVKLTTLCPGNCKCCKNRLSEFKKIDSNEKFFNINNFENLCRAIKNIGGTYIALSGGEPTIVPNLLDFIKIAKTYGLATRLNTSGFNINKENIREWLDAGLDQIVLSIYGIDFETYSKTRGNASMYKKGYEALKIISEMKEKYNFIFILQTVIMKDNYMQMNDLLNLAINYHADKFWPSYLEDAINLPDVRLTSNEITKFKIEVKPLMKNTLINHQMYSDENANNLKDIYNNDYIDYIYHDLSFRCHHLGKHLSFYPNGRIDLCCGFEYTNNCSRYIDYNNIESVLTKEFMQQFENEKIEYCKYCPQGLHREINLSGLYFDEYDGKECLNGKKI